MEVTETALVTYIATGLRHFVSDGVQALDCEGVSSLRARPLCVTMRISMRQRAQLDGFSTETHRVSSPSITTMTVSEGWSYTITWTSPERRAPYTFNRQELYQPPRSKAVSLWSAYTT